MFSVILARLLTYQPSVGDNFVNSAVYGKPINWHDSIVRYPTTISLQDLPYKGIME